MKKIFVPILFLFVTGGLGCKKKDNFDPDKFREIVLTLAPGKDNPRNSEGDFITLKDGRILFIYSHFYGDSFEDHAPAYLAGRYSSDSGKTWTKEDRMFVHNDGEMNVMAASLLRLKNGAIALFYSRKNSMKDCMPMMRLSYDEAETWSDAIPCIPNRKGYFTVNNNRVIQLNSGRILIPVSLHQEGNSTFDYKGKIMCYMSDDNGKTWKPSQTVPNPDNAITQEPGIIARKNGEILMLIRTNSNVQYMSVSKDSGMTWSPAVASSVVSPLSPASLARIPATDDMLLFWNDNNGNTPATRTRRTPYNIAISKDEGNTWAMARMLENNPDGSYCYTAIHFVGQYILIGYCGGSYSQRTPLSITHVARIKLSWVYDHKL